MWPPGVRKNWNSLPMDFRQNPDFLCSQGTGPPFLRDNESHPLQSPPNPIARSLLIQVPAGHLGAIYPLRKAGERTTVTFRQGSGEEGFGLPRAAPAGTRICNPCWEGAALRSFQALLTPGPSCSQGPACECAQSLGLLPSESVSSACTFCRRVCVCGHRKLLAASNLGSAISWLCGPGQGPHPLWAQFSHLENEPGAGAREEGEVFSI